MESITGGEFHNQAAQGAESALSAMLGRSAAYMGRVVTWDELISPRRCSNRGLTYPSLDKGGRVLLAREAGGIM